MSSAVAPLVLAFLSAVRRADRWARLRTVAARDLRMFFSAERIFGTNETPTKRGAENRVVLEPGMLPAA